MWAVLSWRQHQSFLSSEVFTDGCSSKWTFTPNYFQTFPRGFHEMPEVILFKEILSMHFLPFKFCLKLHVRRQLTTHDVPSASYREAALHWLSSWPEHSLWAPAIYTRYPASQWQCISVMSFHALRLLTNWIIKTYFPGSIADRENLNRKLSYWGIQTPSTLKENINKQCVWFYKIAQNNLYILKSLIHHCPNFITPSSSHLCLWYSVPVRKRIVHNTTFLQWKGNMQTWGTT